MDEFPVMMTKHPDAENVFGGPCWNLRIDQGENVPTAYVKGAPTRCELEELSHAAMFVDANVVRESLPFVDGGMVLTR